MNSVLASLPWNTCLEYLDDIIITGKTFTDHLNNLHLVFDHIQEAELKMQPAKCTLCKDHVSILGHIVSPAVITTDPES